MAPLRQQFVNKRLLNDSSKISYQNSNYKYSYKELIKIKFKLRLNMNFIIEMIKITTAMSQF